MKVLKLILFMLIVKGLIIQCIETSSNQFNIYNVKQAQLIREGFTSIFWNQVTSNDSILLSTVSSDCIKSLNYVTRAVEEGKVWPLNMMDSSSRFIIDALSTGYYDYGNYDKCLDINWINHESKESQLGQHCTLSILPTMSESEWPVNIFTRNKLIGPDHGAVFKIALCIPSSCSNKDVAIIFEKALEPFGWHHIKVDQCKVKTTFIDAVIKSTKPQKLALAFLISIILLNSFATWFDWTLKTRPMDEKAVLIKATHWSRHLSLINAYNSLINPGSSSRLTFLTKLQIIVHLYTLSLHSFTWYLYSPGYGHYANTIGQKNTVVNRDSWLVRGGSTDYFIEILFFYGGIARSMEYWRNIDSSTSLASSFMNMLIKMLTIVLNLVPLFALTLTTPLLTDGPLSSAFSEHSASSCLKSFHYNLAFWQNSYKPSVKICLPHTWSVAVEFKLLPVIIILVHLYKRSPKLGAILNALIVTFGMFYVGSNAFINNLAPTIPAREISFSSYLDYFNFFYLRTLTHSWIYMAAPLWTFLIMNKYEKSNAFLSKFTKLGKLFILNLLFMHILPFIWLGLSQFDGPVLNSIYAIIYRVFNLSLYTFVIMSNADQLRQFFIHSMDRGQDSLTVKNNNNNNNIEVLKKEVDQHSNQLVLRLLHIVSTLLRSSYYVHLNMIILLYSGERYPGNTLSAFVNQILKNMIFSLFGGFVFHLFVAHPVLSFCATLKAKSKRAKSQ